MKFRTKQTQHQVARRAIPDAETFNKVFLIKRTSSLRATYQIFYLVDYASRESKKLIIEIPKNCDIHSSLDDLIKHVPKIIKIVRS